MKFRLSRKNILDLSSLGSIQAVSLITGILTSILWTNYTSQEIYGSYKLAMSFISILSPFALVGLKESISISAAKSYSGNLRRIFKFKLIVLLGGCLLLIGISAYYYNKNSYLISAAVLVIGILFPFYNNKDLWTSWLKGKGLFGKLSIRHISIYVSNVIGLSLVIYFDVNDIKLIILGAMGLPAMLSTIYAYNIYRSNKFGQSKNDIVKYGLHVSFATIVSSLIYADKLILERTTNVSAIATYSIAMLFPEQIKKVFTVFDQFFTPVFYGSDSVTQVWKKIKKKFFLLIFIFIIIGVVGFLILPIVIPLLFSEKYSSSIIYAKWLWLSLAVTSPFTYFSNILKAQKKTRYVYLIQISFPLIVFALYFLLAEYGIWGIVFSKIVSYCLSSVLFIGGFVYYLIIENKRTTNKRTTYE